MDILKSVNWVDILCLVMLFRFVYIAAQTGFVMELMKLGATFMSVFVAFHYYTVLAGIVERSFAASVALQVAVFVVLWIATYFICKLIRDGLFMLFVVQADNALDKWGAGLLAFLRVALTASLLMYMALISGQKYLQATTLKSVSHQYLLMIAPKLYAMTCDDVVTRLLPSENKNPAVAETLKGVPNKK